VHLILLVSHCIIGAAPQTQKAKADEFIHIFVNNSKKLTEFLEYMVKDKDKVCICIFASTEYCLTAICETWSCEMPGTSRGIPCTRKTDNNSVLYVILTSMGQFS